MNRVYVVTYRQGLEICEEYVTAKSAQEAVDILFGKGKDHSMVVEVACVVENWR